MCRRAIWELLVHWDHLHETPLLWVHALISSGHYEHLVMPFGLANSPSIFPSFINNVFGVMLNRWVIIYIDDMLIYSQTYEDHVQHVRADLLTITYMVIPSGLLQPLPFPLRPWSHIFLDFNSNLTKSGLPSYSSPWITHSIWNS